MAENREGREAGMADKGIGQGRQGKPWPWGRRGREEPQERKPGIRGDGWFGAEREAGSRGEARVKLPRGGEERGAEGRRGAEGGQGAEGRQERAPREGRIGK